METFQSMFSPFLLLSFSHFDFLEPPCVCSTYRKGFPKKVQLPMSSKEGYEKEMELNESQKGLLASTECVRLMCTAIGVLIRLSKHN